MEKKYASKEGTFAAVYRFRTFALALAFCALKFVSFSQNTSQQLEGKAETERLTKLMHQLEGTYQVQVVNSREFAFPLSVLDMVEAKRKEQDTVYFWVGSNMRIMVLPKNEITKKGFIPVSRISGPESK